MEGGASGGKETEADMASAKKEDDSPEEKGEDKRDVGWLSALLKESMNISEPEEQLLEEVTLDGIVKFMKSEKCKKIVTMAGAGISTSAGIPDFRSPESGLYNNLAKYNLPTPQAIFEIGYFMENPEPFFQLAKELWPGHFKPTPCHYFIRCLHEKGLLLRHFTQNIDTLERMAGLPDDKIVEAHGTFHTCHCLKCNTLYSQEWIKEKIFSDVIPKCEKKDCEGVVKPDIVFFGESLPQKFASCVGSDLPKCDLLIIMGTSLLVQPFASLVNRVPQKTPRLYINLEKTSSGSSDPFMMLLGMGSGFKFDEEDNYRDVFRQATCDDGCYELANKLGWGDELKTLVKSEHARHDLEHQAETVVKATPKPDPKAATPKKSPTKAAAATGKSPQKQPTSTKKSPPDKKPTKKISSI